MSSITGAISLGQLGCYVATTTNAVTAPSNRHFSAIQVLADCKFNVLNNISRDTSGDALANSVVGSAFLLPAGTIIYGTFKNFQLHSGAVIAYYGS